jgi:predicted transcriptional regulator YheO
MPRTRAAGASLAPYFTVADAIATLFKPHVEVVVHDLRTMTIAHIANPIGKRKVGDSSSADRFPDQTLEQAVIGPYRNTGPDGRNMRSVTAVLRDERAHVLGMLCINFDVSMLERVQDSLAAFAFLPASPEPQTFFHDSWRQALEQIVRRHETAMGMSAMALDATGRRALIAQIHDARILDIRNAAPAVASRLGISRASLYKYLRDIHG